MQDKRIWKGDAKNQAGDITEIDMMKASIHGQWHTANWDYERNNLGSLTNHNAAYPQRTGRESWAK